MKIRQLRENSWTGNCILLALFSVLILIPHLSTARATYFQHGSHAGGLIERYEIRTGHLHNGLHSELKPFSRERVSEFTLSLDTFNLSYSQADRFNLDYLHSENLPWAIPDTGHYHDSERPLLHYFYRSKANMFQVNEDNFNLFINPGMYLQAGYSGPEDKYLYTNTRTAEIRGNIDGKIGFYSYIAENQIWPARHELAYYDSTRSHPGAHFTKGFKEDATDFFIARGYVTLRPTESINIMFGHDQNFIGNGYRSLLLSDFAPEYTFLKINTQVWRFNYQNIFARLTDRAGIFSGHSISRPNPEKYAAIHYLSFNILDNLSAGIFEAVTFHDNKGAGRGFDLHYLNPVIFYRAVEHQLNSPDKMLVGLNARYLPVKKIELYGQFMLNEFQLNNLMSPGEGHIHNRYGSQIGLKYIDAFTVSNLDLQVEYNRVRPYSYYSNTGGVRDYPVNNWTHYNHALAHPMGANFYEWIGSVKYQPLPQLSVYTQLTHIVYGADSAGSNWGQNIYRSYNDYEQRSGNKIGQGVETTLNIINTRISYHLFHNLFVELDARYRNNTSEISSRSNENWFIGGTIRLNTGAKGWEF